MFAPTPIIRPGMGFFILNNGATETNTFVGSVVITNSISLLSGAYRIISSAIPVGGGVGANSIFGLTNVLQVVKIYMFGTEMVTMLIIIWALAKELVPVARAIGWMSALPRQYSR